jgi:hypothetical protein
MAHFPMALISTFFVPLAMTLQVISLWQLLRGAGRTRAAVHSRVGDFGA